MQMRISNSILELVKGDITELSCDAIVNAANAQLVLGGGAAVALAESKSAQKIKEKIFANYKKRFGIDSEIYIVTPSDGTEILTL